MDKVGKDGRHHGRRIENDGHDSEVVEGMQLTAVIFALFRTDPERMEAVLDNPFNPDQRKESSSMKDLLPILDRLPNRQTAFDIAEDVEGELWRHSLSQIARNFECRGCKSTGFGDRRKAMLEELRL